MLADSSENISNPFFIQYPQAWYAVLAYAETHYPRLLPSRTRRSEPEIVADVPWRVEPGAVIPVLLVVHDADRYPVEIESLSVLIKEETGEELPPIGWRIGVQVSRRSWWHMESLPALPFGAYEATAIIRYSIGGELRVAFADNYRGTSHRPFALRVGSDPYPLPDGWIAGDIHTHTEYTRDQVEFGPPVAAIAAMSRAMGLGWAALTDHSYDLDDSEEDYLVNDPSLPRWNGLLRACAVHSEVLLIPGEEVSCGNSKDRNVHLLGLGLSQYIPGKGDSAERPFHRRPDLPIPEVVRRIREQGGLALAAHPGNQPPLGERLVFRRGSWEWADLIVPGLTGVQFWNGSTDEGFRRGSKDWVRLLLSGRRVVGVAGNDSHGSFGRSRQVRWPWVSLRDDRQHLFGRARTVVAAPKPDRASILAALAGGKCYLTDGPALTLEVAAEGRRFPLGSEAPGKAVTAHVRAVSTSEWGAISRIGIALGVVGEQAERWTWTERSEGSLIFEWQVPIRVEQPAYVRAEVRTQADARAFTNPIWIIGGG